MTYLKDMGIDFDLLDVDIKDLENDDIESFLEDNRYDIVLSGGDYYKWMKWLTNRVRHYNKSKNHYWSSVAGSIQNVSQEFRCRCGGDGRR